MCFDKKYITGSHILRETIFRYRHLQKSLAHKRIALISFGPTSEICLSRFLASKISAKEKLRAFSAVGLAVNSFDLKADISGGEFEHLLARLNNDPQIIGILIQLPMPARLKEKLPILSKEKDLDSIVGPNRHFEVCAAAESAVRVLSPFLNPRTKVSIVGGKGFVGNGVARALSPFKVPFSILDIGDDLIEMREAELIVSATGHPELLDERHLAPHHRVVVDVGFIPMYPGRGGLRGDVNQRAYPIVQHITPVPGGVGPLQIATLIERIVHLATSQPIVQWRYC